MLLFDDNKIKVEARGETEEQSGRGHRGSSKIKRKYNVVDVVR